MKTTTATTTCRARRWTTAVVCSTLAATALTWLAGSQQVAEASTGPSATAVHAVGRAADAEGRTAGRAAQTWLDTGAGTAGLHLVAHDSLEQTRTWSGTRGTHYVEYRRTYRSLPVVGGDVVVAVDAGGAVTGAVTSQDAPVSIADLTPDLSASDASRIARAQLARAESVTTPRLVVYAAGQPRLAWTVEVLGHRTSAPSHLDVYIDAETGAVLSAADRVSTGDGRGHFYRSVTVPTEVSGSGFALRSPDSDAQCGASPGAVYTGPDDVWGNYGATNLESGCVDVMYAVEQERLMLRDWLGRDGINGGGYTPPASVGLADVNAFWNPDTQSTSFGHNQAGTKLLTSIDIVAHEYGHAVFYYTPGGSDGDQETAGINESVGDMFGAMTEGYVNSPHDSPDFTVGELVDLNGSGPIRHMYDPSLDNAPSCKTGPLPTEEHQAAGPLNHWFYLLSQGTTTSPRATSCDLSTKSGIGLRDAGEIVYNALMLKTGFWHYDDVREATLLATKTLYGTADRCGAFDAVKSAWSGIGMGAKGGDPTCSAAPGTAAVSTAVIIDSSGSMSSTDPSDRRKDAARAYLTASLPSDEVTLVDFDDSVRLLSGPVDVGRNRAALSAQIDTIDSSGGTDLGLGLATGCQSLQHASGPSRAAIFLTDGDGDYNGEAACFASKGWKVYTIGLGGGVDGGLLAAIAAETGGRYLSLSTSTNLVCEFQQIRAEIGGGTAGGCTPTGTVTPGAVQSTSVAVPHDLSQITFTNTWSSGDVEMTVTSPGGSDYNRNSTGSDVVVSSSPTFDSFTILAPQAGTWRVSFRGADVPAGGEPYVFSQLQLSEKPLYFTAPTVTGTAQAGQRLMATEGTWNTAGLQFAYQWLRAGSPIPGATGATYTLTGDDVARSVAVRVRATRADLQPGVATSSAVAVAQGAAAANTALPTIVGSAHVGQQLTASPGSWSAADVEFAYEWLRDGVVVATAPHYVVSAPDGGHQLSVRVTASRIGYAAGSATSMPVAITPGQATLRVLRGGKVKAVGGVLRIRLTSAGAPLSGKLKVSEGSRKLAKSVVDAKGRASVRLPALTSGKHHLTVVYRVKGFAKSVFKVTVKTIDRR